MISRRSTLALCAALVAGAVVSALAIEYNPRRLVVRMEGDMMHVSAPNFSFLNGKSLERLKDGASVAFIAQLTVSREPNYVMADAREMARFAISYDIWGQKFSITKIGDPLDHVSHLSAEAAETWCLDNMAVRRSLLPGDRPFYVQLDLRVEDPSDQSGVIGDSGISLKRMVQIFSRPVSDKQPHWLLQTGPIRLDELLQKRMLG